MQLRKGKTKTILLSSIESALGAVEVYNKPTSKFRIENYIVLMVIAWTKLFHAHFQNTIGEKYFYKKGRRYKRIDNEKKAWELNECIKQYGKLSKAVEKNLELIISIRNRIEHRYYDCSSLDIYLFGECQSLLYNYENLLINLFGSSYSLNCSLAYALQFSTIRSNEQFASQRKLLSREIHKLKEFIDKYRVELSQEIYDNDEYSIKVIIIPKISNTNRCDTAIEFVQWNALDSDDKNKYNQLTSIIKDKVQKCNVYNLNFHKPGKVISKLKDNGITISQYEHQLLWRIFQIRPNNKRKKEEKFITNADYCIYDEVHNDYVYTEKWIEFITNLFQKHNFTNEVIKNKSQELLNINDYL